MTGAPAPATRLVLDRCAVVTMDPQRHEHELGHVVVENGRIATVAAGPAPRDIPDARYVDLTGCLLTPGLVNTHHHLYQRATRGFAVDRTLFEWLTELYPVWAGVDAEILHDAALGALAWLARTGCTTTTDHHYVFPRGRTGLLAAEVQAARQVGLRFYPTRGSMDLGRSAGGLPPDDVVQDVDAILADSEESIDAFHDPAAGSRLRVALAPCSPFSASSRLLAETASLARRRGVLLHTHLAETQDEEEYCRERFGSSSVDYADKLGWLGEDVWLAHAVHLDDDGVAKLGATRTGVAHCPSSNARLGAGIARARELRDAGARVGLGVDGAASNEACSLVEELRHALLFARARGGPTALAVRDALEMATLGGARVLRWDDEIGSLEPGKLADLAAWRVSGPAHGDIDDPVAALVLGVSPPLELLLVGGRPVVESDRLVTVDEHDVAVSVRRARADLLRRAEQTRW